jgi:thioredoxin-related protein
MKKFTFFTIFIISLFFVSCATTLEIVKNDSTFALKEDEEKYVIDLS